MEWIKENLELIIVVFFVGAFAAFLLVMKYLIRLNDYFSNKKFRIISKYEFEPLSGKYEFAIHIFNNNVNDARIVAFGFLYNEQTIDYFKTFFQDKQMTPDQKLVVLSRASFRLSVDVNTLETVIYDANQGKKKVNCIKAYAIDSQGLMTVVKAKEVQKVIQKYVTKVLKEQKEEEIKRANQQRLELKLEKEKERAIRLAKKRDKRSRLWLALKNKFSKKPKE